MGFTKALFYPTIDIRNEEWLKNAVLFWDEINTIVPASMENPYTQNTTQYLSDEGILNGINVNPDMRIIDDLTSDVLNYINTTEGFQLLSQGRDKTSVVHRDKLPRGVRELFRIHPNKLPYEIQHQLRDNLHNDGWLNVDSNFAIFYMTLLANKICEQRAIALLTDNTLTSNFTDLVRLDNHISSKGKNFDYSRNQRERYIHLAQGMLTNLIIDGIKLSPHTSLTDIVKFKKKHSDELGAFRTNISKLTENVDVERPLTAIKQQVEDIYKDEFLPSYNNLKKALDGSGIKWLTENFIKVTYMQTSATAIPMALLGASLPQALIAGAGISMISSIVSYNQDKRQTLRDSPYSYLLAINE